MHRDGLTVVPPNFAVTDSLSLSAYAINGATREHLRQNAFSFPLGSDSIYFRVPLHSNRGSLNTGGAYTLSVKAFRYLINILNNLRVNVKQIIKLYSHSQTQSQP